MLLRRWAVSVSYLGETRLWATPALKTISSSISIFYRLSRLQFRVIRFHEITIAVLRWTDSCSSAPPLLFPPPLRDFGRVLILVSLPFSPHLYSLHNPDTSALPITLPVLQVLPVGFLRSGDQPRQFPH